MHSSLYEIFYMKVNHHKTEIWSGVMSAQIVSDIE